MPAGSSLAAVPCSSVDGSCQSPQPVPTATSDDPQLALVSTRSAGALDWSLALGPVTEAPGSLPDMGAYDLAADDRDWLYLTFVSTGSLQTAGISQFGCEPLVDGAAAGRWLVALQATGFGGEAICAWAQRFGP